MTSYIDCSYTNQCNMCLLSIRNIEMTLLVNDYVLIFKNTTTCDQYPSLIHLHVLTIRNIYHESSSFYPHQNILRVFLLSAIMQQTDVFSCFWFVSVTRFPSCKGALATENPLCVLWLVDVVMYPDKMWMDKEIMILCKYPSKQRKTSYEITTKISLESLWTYRWNMYKISLKYSIILTIPWFCSPILIG